MKKINKKRNIVLILLAIASVIICSCGSEIPMNRVYSTNDLKNQKIGVQLGTTGDIFASDIEGATLERYNKGADAVMSLKLGKVDCVIIDEQPAKEFVKINSDLKILEEEFISEDYAICIKKGNDELIKKINSVIKELKEDGTIDSIINNYVGENAGENPYKSPKDTDRSNGTLRMATNAEFAPYEYIEKGKITGIDVDLAQAIADRLGMKLEIDNIAFDSIITAVSAGKADIGIAGMTVTEERLENIAFSDSYTTSKQVIIVRKK